MFFLCRMVALLHTGCISMLTILHLFTRHQWDPANWYNSMPSMWSNMWYRYVFTFSSLQSKTKCNTGMFLHLAPYKIKSMWYRYVFTFSSLQSKTTCDTGMFLHLAPCKIKSMWYKYVFTFSSLQSKTTCDTGMFLHLAPYKVKQNVIQVCFYI